MTLPKRPQAQRTLESAAQIKRRSDLAPGLPMGYSDQETGDVRALQGDETNAFFKDPVHIGRIVPYAAPITEDHTSLYEVPPAESIDDLLVMPEIDVREARLLTLFIEWISGDPAGPGDAQTLSLFPETGVVFEDGEPTKWFYFGVVNPVLYGSGLYAASDYVSLEENSTAFRDFFVSQLNFTPRVGGPAGTRRNVQLSFDVSDKTAFRFRAGVTRRTDEEDPPDLEPMQVAFYYQLQK